MWLNYMCILVQWFIGLNISFCAACVCVTRGCVKRAEGWGYERSPVSPRSCGNKRWLKAVSALRVCSLWSLQQASVSVHCRESANRTVTAAVREWQHHRASYRKTCRCVDFKEMTRYACTILNSFIFKKNIKCKMIVNRENTDWETLQWNVDFMNNNNNEQ